MKALDYILKNYQKTHDEADGTLMRALVYSLNIEELKTLQRKIIQCGRYRYHFSNYLYQEADHAQGRENESISILLKFFESKNQVTRIDARYRLRDRFDEQSKIIQTKILKAFLYGSKEDRDWAYRSCSWRYWDASLGRDIKFLWEKYREKKCAEIVIKHFPIEFVLDNIESLFPETNYIYLCARLKNYPSFKIDMERIQERYGEWGYFNILANSEGEIKKRDVLQKLYMYIIRFINKEKTLPIVGCMRQNGSMINFRLSLRLGDISTTHFYDMSDILKFIGKLGLIDEIQAFRKWDKKVNKIYNERKHVCECGNHIYDADYLWKLYCSVIAENMPREFQHLISGYVRSASTTLPDFNE